MLPKTHRQIGRLIYEILYKESNIRLKKYALEFGSIKPDMTPRLKSIPHTMEHSYDLLRDLIYEIYDKPRPLTKKEMRRFSVQLGVLLHFVSDYFCYAHNKGFNDPLRFHYFYERKLGKRFAKNDWSQNFVSLYRYPYYHDLNTSQAIIDFVRDAHNKYLEMPHRISSDIYNCIETCTTVANAIVLNRFMNNVDKQNRLTG